MSTTAIAMDDIITHVAPKHRSWVVSLGAIGIANLLNLMASHEQVNVNEVKIMPVIPEQAAANQGKAGEARFEDIVNKHLGSCYVLVNNAKKGHSGDFLITWKSDRSNRVYRIIIDVKNYKKSAVPTKEVDKLYRDLNTNAVDAGFMITYGGRITGVSKAIDMREATMDSGRRIPIVFASINTPEVICELIKMIFHAVEIKDITRNGFDDLEGLFYQVAQLNGNIQMFLTMRDTLRDSQTTINKSLDAVRYKLMECEFSLAGRINAINKTLVVQSAELDMDMPDEDTTPLTMMKNIQQTFNILGEHVPLLNAIFVVGWSGSSVNVPKRQWTLCKEKDTVVLKVLKAITVIFPTISENMLPHIDAINRDAKKMVRRTSAGLSVKLTQATVSHIVSLCQTLV
jgi:hypothetical protein